MPALMSRSGTLPQLHVAGRLKGKESWKVA